MPRPEQTETPRPRQEETERTPRRPRAANCSCESRSIIFCDGDELTVALVRVPDLRIEDIPARARGKIEHNSARPLPPPCFEMAHGPGAAYDVHAKQRFEFAAEFS